MTQKEDLADDFPEADESEVNYSIASSFRLAASVLRILPGESRLPLFPQKA